MSYNPAELEQLIFQKKFDLVEQNIIEFICHNTDPKHFIKLADTTSLSLQEEANYEQLCTVSAGGYATLITRMFCEPSYQVSEKILDVFSDGKEVLELIFAMSAWKNTDPIIEKMGMLNLLKLQKFQYTNKRKRQLKALLSLYCTSSKHQLPWKRFFDIAPDIARKAYFSLITQNISVLDKDRCRGFNDLLAQAEHFPIINLKNEQDVQAIAAPFFACSYATGKKKYAFKKWVAEFLPLSIKHWLSEGTKEKLDEIAHYSTKKRPKMGVMLEAFARTHAMYRCYQAPLIALSQQYELVAFIREKKAINCDFSAFEKVEYIQDEWTIDETVNQVLAEKLDLVFYPSIGMDKWTIMLSSIRLASIQIMMGGHPTSSFSKSIDYFVLPGNSFTADEIQPFISEKAVVINNSDVNYHAATRHVDLTDEFIEENSQFLEGEDEIKIGVNGVMLKVSADTIEVCRKISQLSDKKITFVFFSTQAKFSLGYLSIKAQLEKYLPSFEFNAYAGYSDYLKVLSRCHFLLPTLPFGGSNSNIDAMVLKKPKLFLRGREQLYTRADQQEWQPVGLEQEFGADSIDELVSKALALINSEDKRRQLHQFMLEACSSEKIFPDPKQSKNSQVSVNDHFDAIISEVVSTQNASDQLMLKQQA